MRKRTALVTGASGFIGMRVVGEVLAQDVFSVVYCLIREKSKNLGRFYEVIGEGNEKVKVVHGVEKCLEGVEVNVVFHLAAVVELVAKDNNMENTNISGTRNVLEMAVKKGVERFVFVSSVAVYGLQENVNENSEKKAVKGFMYGYSKFEAEKMVREYWKSGKLDVVILQPGIVFGEYDSGWSAVILGIYYDEFIGSFSGVNSYSYVGDVAKGIVLGYMKGKSGEEYILGGTVLPVVEFMNIVRRELGKKEYKVTPYWKMYLYSKYHVFISRLKGVKPWFVKAVLDSFYMVQRYDSSKAIKELGYEITNIMQNLKTYIDWYKESIGVELNKS